MTEPAGSARPPLVLLHGLTYDRRQWGPLIQALASLDPARRVVAFDLPGHGEAPPLESYDPDEVAALLHDSITAAGFEAPVLVGHSLGGVLATRYAARFPAAGVVNVDQPLLVAGFARMLREAEPVLRGPDFGRVWAGLVAGMGVDELPPEARELVRTATTPRQDLLLGYWAELLTIPAELLAERVGLQLASIRRRGIPYHYVGGHEPDPAFRGWLAEQLPEARVSVLAGCGHFPHLGRPAELAALLTD